MVRRTIGERSIPVYFEVPNVRFTLQDWRSGIFTNIASISHMRHYLYVAALR